VAAPVARRNSELKGIHEKSHKEQRKEMDVYEMNRFIEEYSDLHLTDLTTVTVPKDPLKRPIHHRFLLAMSRRPEDLLSELSGMVSRDLKKDKSDETRAVLKIPLLKSPKRRCLTSWGDVRRKREMQLD
jgi:hypothetical protein